MKFEFWRVQSHGLQSTGKNQGECVIVVPRYLSVTNGPVYRGSPVYTATAATGIPAAIFFVYETLSRPMAVASSHPRNTLPFLFLDVSIFI